LAKYLNDDAIQQKQMRILDAALSVFVRKGYGQSTIPDIAGEAGVAVGTIYNYFENKQHLLVSLMRNRFFTDPLVKLMKDVCEKDEEAFLSALLADRIGFGIENIDTFLFLFSEIQRNPEVRAEYLEHILHPMLDKIQAFIESNIAADRFRSEDPALLARAIAGIGLGLVLFYSIEREESPLKGKDPQILAETLANVILNGLRQVKEESPEREG
jgi:AcrR family transcriptional regulator